MWWCSSHDDPEYDVNEECGADGAGEPDVGDMRLRQPVKPCLDGEITVIDIEPLVEFLDGGKDVGLALLPFLATVIWGVRFQGGKVSGFQGDRVTRWQGVRGHGGKVSGWQGGCSSGQVLAAGLRGLGGA